MVRPKARKEGIISDEVADEVVVFDRQRKRAHRLNRTLALVWRNCDGTKSVADIVKELQKELNEVADENLVLLSLNQLNAAHLLEESGKVSSQEARSSRRAFVGKVGAVGVLSLLLPLITSMSVPTPAEAATCIIVKCFTCTLCVSS
jgi:Coenzyme PQQ synthesis protein D (PqqD)